MDALQLIELATGFGNRLDVQVGIFITVHLAIFGGIIYVDRPLRTSEKIASIFIYTIFAFLNFRMMQSQLNLLFNAYIEIAKYSNEPCCSSNEIILYMSEELNAGKFKFRFLMLNTGHILMYFMVLLSILFDKALSMMITSEPKKL